MARTTPAPPGGSLFSLPTVVLTPSRRTLRPTAKVPSTEPPLESSTSVAPVTSRLRVNAVKSLGVSLVIAPTAEMKVRHSAPQALAGPSSTSSKRMGKVRTSPADVADVRPPTARTVKTNAVTPAWRGSIIIPLAASCVKFLLTSRKRQYTHPDHYVYVRQRFGSTAKVTQASCSGEPVAQ